MEIEGYKILTHKDDPSLRGKSYQSYRDSWDEFMLHDEIAILYKEQIIKLAPSFQFFILDKAENVVGICKSLPIHWTGDIENLPVGYDDALKKAVTGLKKNTKSNTLLGLSVTIPKAYRNLGLSTIGLKAMKKIAFLNNFEQLIVPVRPNLKHKYPITPIEDYIKWKTNENLFFDPWLRTHLGLGAKVLKISKKSMVIKGTVEDWETWTKSSFPQTGKYIINSALVPLVIDIKRNKGVYSEPNVWVGYDFTINSSDSSAKLVEMVR